MFPVIFESRFFTLHTYWIFFFIAIVAAAYTLIWQAHRNSMKLHFLSANSGLLLLSGIAGARIVYLLLNAKWFFINPGTHLIFDVLKIWDGGLSGWGAIAGLLPTLFYLCKKNEQNFWKWLDTIVPAILVAFSITSLGAFFDGMNYGRETSLPWGVNFENMTVKYTVPIHPTQIYSALYNGILATALIISRNFEKIKTYDFDGFIGLTGLTVFSFLRFLEEFLRGDDTWILLGIRTPFIITFITTAFFGTYLFKKYKKAEKQA